MKNQKVAHMKRSLKQVVAVFVIALLLVPLLSFINTEQINATTGDEVKAAKKIVSVVYDDSGSMKWDRWPYANYATQALIALMNEQDELYITFMREPDVTQQISLSDLQGSVNMIHDLDDSGYTPEQALDTAMATLDGIYEDDPTTQFWFIVMTDGEIYDANNNEIDIQSKLDSYKNKVMSNSSTLNIVYLGMLGAAPVTADPANSLYSYMPDDDSMIVSAMQEISNLVSSRIVADNITVIDSTTVQVSSELPLYNISVLSQRSSAYVVSANTEEIGLNVQRNISLDATDLPLGVEMPSLYGNAAVIDCENSDEQLVIPSGTYTIVFSEEVSVEDLTIQFEPAIGFRTEITRNGVELDSVDDLEYGDKVNIKLVPIIPGTDEVIPEESLPDDMTWNIVYQVDDTVIASAQSNELTDVTITDGANVIQGTILIPGFAPYIRENDFIIEIPVEEPEIEIVYNFGIVTDQPEGLSYDRMNINKIVFDQTNTVKFTITNDGVPLSKEELDALGLTLTIDRIDYAELETKGFWNWLASKSMGCRLEQNEDGSFSLIPEVPAFFFTTLFIKDGTYTATVKLNADETITAEGTFTLVRNPAEDGIPFIPVGILLLLIYLFYILFVKKKFKRQIVHYDSWMLARDGTGYKQQSLEESIVLNTPLNVFSLKKECYRHYRGLTLVAGDDGQVFITGKSIAKSVAKYGTSPYNPEKKLRSIVKSLDKTAPDEDSKDREASDMELTNTPLYFMSSIEGPEVWRLWMDD